MPNGASIQRSKTKVVTASPTESVSGVSVSHAASGKQGLGNDIRALRKSRGLTLQRLAKKLQRSVGFVSQLERGISEPSISDLRNIAAIFEVPISLFFGQSPGDPLERGFVVRSGSRRKLGGKDADLVEELLSPDLGGSFEIIRSEFAPDARRDEVETRETEEAGYLVSGHLDLEIDGQWFELHPGDSFRFGAVPMRWENRGDEAAVVIWVISPPVY
jgi:transcriptional regulator with XRE-family HTH domain